MLKHSHSLLVAHMSLLLGILRFHPITTTHAFVYSKFPMKQPAYRYFSCLQTFSTYAKSEQNNNDNGDDHDLNHNHENDTKNPASNKPITNLGQNSLFDEIFETSNFDTAVSATDISADPFLDHDEYEQHSSFEEETGNNHNYYSKSPKPQFMTGRVSATTMEFLKRSSNGYGSSETPIEYLEQQLQQVQNEIYDLNNGVKFNVNSPKQVAQVLFGPENIETTNKDVLGPIIPYRHKIVTSGLPPILLHAIDQGPVMAVLQIFQVQPVDVTNVPK